VIDITVNTALASPLLSRFDLVLVLVDSQDMEWDNQVSSYILNGQMDNGTDNTYWSLPLLRAYISHVKTIKPELTPESKEILMCYYKKQRQADMKNAARTTIRLLESLIRLAEGHARLMYRKRVTMQDAIIAVILMESSMHTSALLGVQSALHSLFPDDPELEYKKQETLLLKRLGLAHLIPDGPSPFSQSKPEDEYVSVWS
jgi:DNA helicase MCM9